MYQIQLADQLLEEYLAIIEYRGEIHCIKIEIFSARAKRVIGPTLFKEKDFHNLNYTHFFL